MNDASLTNDERESVNLDEIVGRMEAPLRRLVGSQIDIQIVRNNQLWNCQANVAEIENLLLYLAYAAEESMQQSGILTIETGNVRLDEYFASRYSGIQVGEYVLLAVSDNGRNMAPVGNLGHAEKRTALAIGGNLSAVHGLVELSGGYIQVYSEPGIGSTVKVFLPRADAKRSQADGDQEGDGDRHGNGEYILVVEDDPSILALTVRMLGLLGYRTYQAEGTEAARSILESNPEVSAMLIDVVLGGQVEGPQLAVVARQIDPELGIVFMSGYTENALLHENMIKSTDSVLEKPFTKKQLAASVQLAVTSHNS